MGLRSQRAAFSAFPIASSARPARRTARVRRSDSSAVRAWPFCFRWVKVRRGSTSSWISLALKVPSRITDSTAVIGKPPSMASIRSKSLSTIRLRTCCLQVAPLLRALSFWPPCGKIAQEVSANALSPVECQPFAEPLLTPPLRAPRTVRGSAPGAVFSVNAGCCR